MTLDDTDPTFPDDLEASRESLMAVASYLSKLGYGVALRPISVRPNVKDWRSYSDQCDLEVLQPVEVKHRPRIHFTSAEDFPFDTVIVDVCRHWDEAKPKPHAYFVCNASLTHALVVPKGTAAQWQRVRKYDKRRNREREFYECPLSLVRSVALVAAGGDARRDAGQNDSESKAC